jgi:hypothetical protein
MRLFNGFEARSAAGSVSFFSTSIIVLWKLISARDVPLFAELTKSE